MEPVPQPTAIAGGGGLTQCGACFSAYRYSSGGEADSVKPGGAGSTAFLASFPAFVKGPGKKKHRRDNLLDPCTATLTKGMNTLAETIKMITVAQLKGQP